mmetsp:Transcript_46032/g.89927  ORF Transcript_46032/g.89927 Transcript_46032/m.89927 type:complete len:292 (-) Transcript_46032:35-910(-)
MSEENPLIGIRNMRTSSNDDDCGCSWICCFFVIVILVFTLSHFFVVQPGEIGIIVTFGSIRSVGPGLQSRKLMGTTVLLQSSKLQLLEEKNTIPTKEGLSVILDTAVLFRLDVDMAATLYRKVGPNYVNNVIKPESDSAIRSLTTNYDAKALYTSERNTIQDDLKASLAKKLRPRGIIVEDVLLVDVGLPALLEKSINMNAQAEQDAIRMEFVLTKERQEAERKAIEAQGISDFQTIVSEGISDKLLRWKAIEATEKLAQSPHSRVVIVGSSGENLPVVLNAGGSTAQGLN